MTRPLAVTLVAWFFMLWALVVLLMWIVGVLGLTLAVSGLSVSLYMKATVAVTVAILLLRPKSLVYFTHAHNG